MRTSCSPICIAIYMHIYIMNVLVLYGFVDVSHWLEKRPRTTSRRAGHARAPCALLEA
jgi:hypothetical protein